jgi:hypothetical protein
MLLAQHGSAQLQARLIFHTIEAEWTTSSTKVLFYY